MIIFYSNIFITEDIGNYLYILVHTCTMYMSEGGDGTPRKR